MNGLKAAGGGEAVEMQSFNLQIREQQRLLLLLYRHGDPSPRTLPVLILSGGIWVGRLAAPPAPRCPLVAPSCPPVMDGAAVRWLVDLLFHNLHETNLVLLLLLRRSDSTTSCHIR